jgi:hypothetical protein
VRKLLIGAVILAVLLVAADRISVAVAENQISNRLTSAYGLAGKPGVTITGFPSSPRSRPVTTSRSTFPPARCRSAAPCCIT